MLLGSTGLELPVITQILFKFERPAATSADPENEFATQ